MILLQGVQNFLMGQMVIRDSGLRGNGFKVNIQILKRNL